jgi:hypothetical protein
MQLQRAPQVQPEERPVIVAGRNSAVHGMRQTGSDIVFTASRRGSGRAALQVHNTPA